MATQFIKIKKGTSRLLEEVVTEEVAKRSTFAARNTLIETYNSYGNHTTYKIEMMSNGELTNPEIAGFVFNSVVSYEEHRYQSREGSITCTIQGVTPAPDKEEFSLSFEIPFDEYVLPHIIETMVIIATMGSLTTWGVFNSSETKDVCNIVSCGKRSWYLTYGNRPCIKYMKLPQKLEFLEKVATVGFKVCQEYDFMVFPFKRAISSITDKIREDLEELTTPS